MEGLEGSSTYMEHARRIIDMEKDKCERGLLYPIIRFLWPISVAATLVGFVILLKHGLKYEACLQAVVLLMQIYVWPKKEED